MLKKSLITCMAVGAIASCTPVPHVAITQAAIDPVYTPAGKALAANENFPNEVRTYSRVDGKRAEVAGVPCEVSTKYYSVKFTTPAIVNFPTYADKTPPATFECTLNGETKTEVREPVNITVLQKSSKYYVAGGLVGGALAQAAVSATNDPAKSLFGYNQFHMTFK